MHYSMLNHDINIIETYLSIKIKFIYKYLLLIKYLYKIKNMNAFLFYK